MKITIISDTHGLHEDFGTLSGDVLIHAGDFYHESNRSDRKLEELNAWFARQDFDMKIFVPGNDDLVFWRSWYAEKDYVKEATLLIDRECEHDGATFFGSPWMPSVTESGFNIDHDLVYEKWKLIPDRVDVLVTRVPPLGILDEALLCGHHLGCPMLRKRVLALQPRLHVFRHVPDCSGIRELGATTFVNASHFDGFRAHPPRTIEL